MPPLGVAALVLVVVRTAFAGRRLPRHVRGFGRTGLRVAAAAGALWIAASSAAILG